jgi:cell division protein FtsB
MAHTETHHTETPGSWTISVLFWLTLLAAVSVYALVALSPKLLTYLELRQEYLAQQVQLVRVEHQIDDLRAIAVSLKQDPDFVRKLASVEFGAARPDEEHIPVDEPLQISIRDNDPVFEPPAESQTWLRSAIRPFATHRQLRGTTLLIAAGMLIFAFTCLQSEGTSVSRLPHSESQSVRRVLSRDRD